MKSIITSGILLSVFFISTLATAQSTIVLSNGEWEPYLSKKLKHYGVASHIVTEAFKSKGYSAEYKWYGDSWKRAYKDALDGKVDGSLIWSKKPERLKAFYFSDSVTYGDRDVFLYRKADSFDWKSVADLKGKKLGGVLGYTYGILDSEEKNGNIIIERVPKEAVNIKKLLKKRIDLFIANEAIIKKLLKELPGDQAESLVIHPKAVNEKTYHLILTKAKKENAETMKKFDEGLAELKKSGKYDQFIKDSKEGKYEQ